MFIQVLLILVIKMEPGNRLSSIVYSCVTDTVNIDIKMSHPNVYRSTKTLGAKEKL